MTYNPKFKKIFLLTSVLLCGLLGLLVVLGLDISFKADYSQKLFNPDIVHTIDVQIDDWADFIADAPKEEYHRADLVIDGEAFGNIGIRAKGNNSRRLTEKYSLARYSLKIEFDHYHDGLYYGLDKFSLDSSFQDNSYMKSFLTYEMMRYMGVPAPLTSYVNVTVNGENWGLFLAIEEPEEGFALRNFGENYGQLYKPEYTDLDADNADLDLRYIDDNIASYDNIFRKAKFDPSESEKQAVITAIRALNEGESIERYINVDEVMRFFAVQVFTLNLDSYIGPTGHNYFLHEQNGRLSMLPWDYNLAYGTYCFGMTEPIRDEFVLINYPVNTPWKGEVMLDRPLFHTLMKNRDYFELYHKYLDKLLSEYIENGRAERLIMETAQLISPYVQNDPTAFCTYDSFEDGYNELIKICNARGKAIRGQLDGEYPITLAQRYEAPEKGVDTSGIDMLKLGDFDDMKEAQKRWENIKYKYNIQ